MTEIEVVKPADVESRLGTLSYDSNNSGGSWWLSDDDWRALEAAGWEVDWYANKDDSWGSYQGGRFLGALASEAKKKFATPEQGVKEWADLTGQNPFDEGCNCCGRPHNFSFTTPGGQCRYLSVNYGAINAEFI